MTGMNEADNQPPPLTDYNLWEHDPLLRSAVEREGGGWIAPRAGALGALLGSERMQLLAAQANRYTPELKTHDRYGNRIDAVEYHPAYHELMAVAFGNGLHSIAWKPGEGGRFVARGALLYLWNQLENGVACPVTMSFAAVHMLRHDAQLAAEWEPRLLADDYDPRPLPLAGKRAVTIGMAMTEKQGGSDLRSNQTSATVAGDDGWSRLTGHKWFCSAPMSDAFFTLARSEAGLSCYFVPRSLPDGSRNPFHLQRLKDKCGNRSNASSEVEYDATLAKRIGEEGRGIPTLIAMAHLTRFDIVLASAGMMRAALAQAVHHANFRSAFGRRLAEQPLMQNVLADMALESEAATLLAFRLARAFDAGMRDRGSRDAASAAGAAVDGGDAREQLLMRLMTPIAKYWLCKRLPALVVEAMECLGGNGYVEEAPLARLYREAPLNSIWEGSGNVICLDVLRSFARAPEAKDVLLEEIRLGGPAVEPFAAAVERALDDPATLEVRARRVVELMALGLQASLMQRHASTEAADAFVASRSGDWGHAFGTLSSHAPLARILAHSAAC
ncbi:MAG: DNA alkylation response protein [Betaproteobacteria bacterium]|nr:DNA alkylation response protein [Betaproteobacteria bacterium]